MYFGDTDSLYIEKKYWDVLDEAKLVGKKLCQVRNNSKLGGIFCGFFLPPKLSIV